MRKHTHILLFSFLLPFHLYAQVFPKEWSVLNYRIVGFVFPATEQANDYLLEIAAGTYNDADSFKKKISISLHSRNNRIIAEVPTFGESYTWRVKYTARHSKITTSTLFHFSTGKTPAVDTTVTRLRIIKKTTQYPNSYVFLDGSMVLYDMNGNPVWYLPETDATAKDPGNHRDMKLTNQGTITFITATNAYEIAYDGSVLWKAPNDGKVSGESNENYHHEFTRLSNGHYMIMGTTTRPVYVKTTLSKNGADSILFVGKISKGLKEYREVYNAMSFSTIIEYDEKGKVVWSYNTSEYFTGSDLLYHRFPDGNIDLRQHDNGFFLDERTNALYISFKNFSRIIKVKYPEGVTLNTYGKIFKPGSTLPVDREGKYIPGAFQSGNGMFCGQHSCRCSQKGHLYLFSNNVCESGSLPKLVVMQQPNSQNDTLKKIWEYECELEPEDKKLINNINFASGGNVEELPDGSFFATMSNGYSKIFIVNTNKEILWSAMSEKWNSYLRKWEMIPQYRASIITSRDQLEKLIWGTEHDK